MMDEITRNRLLRRVDWRFLLANPEPDRSICFTPGLISRAVEIISAVTVTPDELTDCCDLAVAVNPDARTLRAAWTALAPGASLYTEWTWRGLVGHAGIRRHLTLAHFGDIALYWPWPPPSRSSPAFWLPLDDPPAIRYFLASRRPASGRFRRVVSHGLRALWLLLYRVGFTPLVSAVATKPRSGNIAGGWHQSAERSRTALTLPGNNDVDDIAGGILAKWRGAEDRGEHGAPSLLLLTGGARSINKVVGLAFGPREEYPKVAVKMSRVPDAAIALQREGEILQGAHTRRPGGVAGVPQVLFVHHWKNLSAICETALEGVPLLSLLTRDTFHDLALQATAWLADLAGRPPALPRSVWWDRLIESTLSTFATSYGPVLAPAFLEQTRALLATLGALPLVCEQRDFSPWNVLLDAHGQLIVLDWESAELDGLPGLDLVYFLTYLSFFHDGAMESGHFLESYRKALDPSTPTGKVHAECLKHYAELVGLNPEVLRPLRALTWLIHSRSEYRRLTEDAREAPDGDRLRSSLFLRLLEMEVNRSPA